MVTGHAYCDHGEIFFRPFVGSVRHRISRISSSYEEDFLAAVYVPNTNYVPSQSVQSSPAELQRCKVRAPTQDELGKPMLNIRIRGHAETNWRQF